MGYPNVYLAESEEEKEALEARYTEAIASSEVNGTLTHLQAFEAAVKESHAVVAMNGEVLRLLATNPNALYSTYDMTVNAEIRTPAIAQNDQKRRAADSRLWGTAATRVRYAALSLDGSGLTSYGDYFVTIDDTFIEHRSTVLSENSYDFLKNVTFDSELPKGFRSVWSERHKVVVAKCFDQVLARGGPASFPSVLLTSGKNRSQDRFVEVHIYDGFDFAACKSIRVARVGRNRNQQVDLKIIRKYALDAGKDWSDD